MNRGDPNLYCGKGPITAETTFSEHCLGLGLGGEGLVGVWVVVTQLGYSLMRSKWAMPFRTCQSRYDTLALEG